MTDIFKIFYDIIVAAWSFVRLGLVAITQIPHYFNLCINFLSGFVAQIPPFFQLFVITAFNIGLLKFITNRGGKE